MVGGIEHKSQGDVHFKKAKITLAGVAQWIECWPVNQSVSGLIPNEGTYVGCQPGPR